MKYIYIYSVFVLFSMASCREMVKIKDVKTSIQNIDSIISNSDKVVLDYSYCDLVYSKGFNVLKKTPIDITNVDSLTYGFKIASDKILFIYQFSNSGKEKQDRNLIFNNKKALVKRVFIKDSTSFKFDGFMCDYRNARFYSSNDILLIKSQPSEWTGLMNQYEFYQVFDKKSNTCYEFFLNEDKGCNQ